MKRALCAALMVMACAKDRAGPVDKGAADHEQRAKPDSAALARADSAVWRRGDTLFLRLGNGGVLTRIDSTTESESTVSYEYIDRIVGADGHVLYIIDERNWDGWPTHKLVDSHTGASVNIASEPVVSPDSTRFVLAVAAGEPCDSWVNAIEVWHFTKTLPSRDWSVRTARCKRPPGWAPIAARWQSADTIRFRRVVLQYGGDGVTSPSRDTLEGTLIYTSSRWTLDSASRAALPLPD